MTRLSIWLDRDLVGWLSHEPASNQFAFEYAPKWKARTTGFAISPRLPLERPDSESAEAHSADVRQFFENLLPEGEALDHAAQANGISRSNLVGLMVALGKETAGALRVSVANENDGDAPTEADPPEALRPVTREQLSQRIRDRVNMPFSVWDGKVRLSIAGYQDKIAVYERGDEWFLVEGPKLASTVIVKPVPLRAQLQSLPANEFMCMQLAHAAGLAVPRTRLVHVPEPVLLVTRFDRIEQADRVARLHVVDACQALGMSVSMKYERPYGDNPDMRHIRDGVTHAKLFGLLDQSPTPARDKQALLRWVIFQVLIGNTDAHGKNVSFFCGIDGLRLAPAYDMVCMPALGDPQLSPHCAMSIGEAFSASELSPFEWASFADDCRLPLRMVSQQLKQFATRVRDSLPAVASTVREAGVDDGVARAVAETVRGNCERWIAQAPAVGKFRETDVS